MPGNRFKTITDYIDSSPEEVQNVLEKVGHTIKEATLNATKTINYGIPTFQLNGKNLAHFAAFAKHIGFYPTPDAITIFKKEIKDYKQAKGSVQFQLDKPIPYALVKRITEYRVNQILEKGSKRK